MPLTISFEDELGTEIEAFDDEVNMLVSAIGRQPAGSFRLVEAIDPYGDTVFNRLQMTGVISDFATLLPLCREDSERQLVSGVLRLAKQCEANVHTYLKFYGD